MQPTSGLSESEIAMSKFKTPESRGRQGSQDGLRLDRHQSCRPDLKRPDGSSQRVPVGTEPASRRSLNNPPVVHLAGRRLINRSARLSDEEKVPGGQIIIRPEEKPFPNVRNVFGAPDRPREELPRRRIRLHDAPDRRKEEGLGPHVDYPPCRPGAAYESPVAIILRPVHQVRAS